MSVFNYLTDKDKELIEEYIDTYADRTSSITDRHKYIGLRYVLGEWAHNKDKFLSQMFGDKLILSRPFTYKMSVEGLYREYNNLINEDKQPWNMAYSWIKKLFYDECFNYDVFDALVNHVISKDGLVNNAYDGDNFIIPCGEGQKPIKISRGMKPMRIIHSLAERFDPDFFKPDEISGKSNYDLFCIWHSRLFNQANIDGELCLSIHPLDFMTMSDNGNGWESCMTWSRDNDPGDYRAGTLECMNSPYIVIAYLHNPKHKMNRETMKNEYLQVSDEWEWNSKRWRELFIVQDGLILEIKGYPYQDENLTNAALMWIKELAHNNLGWDYNDEELNVQESVKIDEENYYTISPETTYHMYNDIGTLTKHRMRVNYEKLNARCEKHEDGFDVSVFQPYDTDMWHHLFTIPYGGIATCMCCGDALDNDESRSNMVLCSECLPGYKCGCCGEWIEGNNYYYIPDCDDPICEYCYENNTIMDDLTDELHFDGDSYLYTINWAPVADEEGKCLTNENGTPLFYGGKNITVYDPDCNNAYKALFNGEPKEYYKPNFFGYGGSYYWYVTTDMIKDKEWFERVFELSDPIDEEIADWVERNAMFNESLN